MTSTVTRALIASAIVALSYPAVAQSRHVFDVDASQSVITFSGTVTVLGIAGNMVGQPNTFNLQGAADLDVTAPGGVISTAQFVNGGSNVLVPAVNAVVPGLFPITAKVTNAQAVFTSVNPTTLAPVSFPVGGGGAFSTDLFTNMLGGQATFTALGQTLTVPFAGLTGSPQAISGTLKPTANGLQLQIPVNVTFPFSSSSTGVLITGTGTVSGTVYADDRALATDVGTISLGSGGTQTFSLSAGTTYANKTYLLLGSASGTSPGINVGGLNIPLNLDGWMLQTLSFPNVPPFGNSVGTLDSLGLATATLSTPPLNVPALLGITFHHAYVVIPSTSAVFASNPVPLQFVP